MGLLLTPAGAGAERTSERSLFSKVFDHATVPGRRILQAVPFVLHKPRDIAKFIAGQATEYDDCDLTPNFANGVFSIASAWYQIDLDVQNLRLHATWLDGSDVFARLVMTPDPGMTVERVKPSIFLRNVQPGLDIEFRFWAQGFEIYKIVASAQAPQVLDWQYRWKVAGLSINPDPLGETAFDASGFRAQLGLQRSAITTDAQGYRTCSLRETLSGKAIAVQGDPASGWTRDAAYPVTIDTTFSADIGADADDGFERVTSADWFNSYANIFYLGYGGTQPFNGGLRWQNVTVPQGATINSSSLQFNISVITNTPAGTAYGDNVDNAAAWSSSNRPSGITQTTANQAFSYTTTGSKTIDVTAIVQEIVNRAGWASGNSMRFGLLNTAGSANNVARVRDSAVGSGDIPTLTIDYTAGAAATGYLNLPLLGVG